jgi:DNA gyrase subunit B
MTELINRGFLYVAQPPLYRVVDGKKERFLKDEEEFNTFLLERIAKKGTILLGGTKEVSGQRLVRLLTGLIKFYENLKKLSKRGYSNAFLEFMASESSMDRNAFKDKAFMEAFFEKLQDNGFQVKDIHVDEESQFYEFVVSEVQNGGLISSVNWEFLSSPELRQLLGIAKEFKALKNGSYLRLDNGEKIEIDDPEQLLNEFMEKAKKGITIQRYKGLGEMNPNQLWSTTMDPEKRTLLQVRVEDAFEADGIFTVLMGDKVEPRREFIQKNALEVKELDI